MGRKAAELENLLWGLWDVSVCNDYLTRPCCPPLLNQLKPPPVHRLRNYPARSGVISSFGELSKLIQSYSIRLDQHSPLPQHYFIISLPTHPQLSKQMQCCRVWPPSHPCFQRDVSSFLFC